MMDQMMRNGYTTARSKRIPRRYTRDDPVRADCNKGRSMAIGGGSAVWGTFSTVPVIVAVDMTLDSNLKRGPLLLFPLLKYMSSFHKAHVTILKH